MKLKAVILLLIMSLSDLGRISLLIRYMQEAGTYAIELCINKDRPEMQCNGQCHLSEELKALDHVNDEEGIPLTKTQIEDLGMYLITSTTSDDLPSSDLAPSYHKEYKNLLKSTELLADIFHPPIIV